MKKILITIITVLTFSTAVNANTFTCYDPNSYQQIELVNGDTGTALFFKVFDTTLYRHGTGVNGESVYVDESGDNEIQVKLIHNNLTFIKLFYKDKLQVILSCKENQ